MEHKTFFYDDRLLNMSLMSYNEICKTLGSPIIMLPNPLINEHIHYYSYQNRFEVKFFYRVYYIGSALLSTIYNKNYFKENYHPIFSKLSKGQLPEIYDNVVGKITIKDLISTNEEPLDDTSDGTSTNKKQKEENNEVPPIELSEDILQLFKHTQTIQEEKKERTESKMIPSSDASNASAEGPSPSTNAEKQAPVLHFKYVSDNMKNKIWQMLPAEYKMDLIKNCIVIDALQNYSI